MILQETGKLINPSPDPILIVDDDRKMRVIMKTLIESSGWTTIEACDGVQALEMYSKERPSVVLLDMLMPKMDGLETLRALKSLDSDLPVIIITAHADVSDAVNAIKIGAYDFIVKPPDLDTLTNIIRRAIEKSKLSRSFRVLDAAIDNSLESLLGSSSGMKKVIEQIRQVAFTDFSIIIQGETGTGKTTVARMLHNMSKRSLNPFVSVDVGNMPEALIESELFGHEKGSYTGAIDKQKGFFEVAAGGTILIDDFQNVPLYTQSKLLRTVEDKKIFTIGARQPVEIDVSIIVATKSQPFVRKNWRLNDYWLQQGINRRCDQGKNW